MISRFLICVDRHRNSYRYVGMYVCMRMSIHICIPRFCSIDCGSSVISIVMGTPTTYTSISKHQKKKSGLLGKMTDSTAGRENTMSFWSIY